MPHFKRTRRHAVLTAGQRTSLGTLLTAVFPGLTLANAVDVTFSRDGQGGVEAHLLERVPVAALTDLNDGDTVERT